MDSQHFLKVAVVLLLSTVVIVPLTRRFRLGAVLGYLLAGIAIGPRALGLVRDTGGIAAISEFGVVLMLFVIGLELSPRRLWVMRRQVFGTGLLQVLATSLVIGMLGWRLAGLVPGAALIVAGSLALSSTAFGLQILAERKETGSAYGRQAFAILLFQDLAAIPLIAMVPLLAASTARHGFDLGGTLRAVGMILAVVVGGRYLLRPLFRFVAKADTVEVATATALLVVMGVALLMELAGMSVTLGAFLAGVLLADSEYRHELESHIEPFKGLLLGLFFVSVGMAMDMSLLLREPWLVLALVAALLLVKGAVLWPLGRYLGGLDAGDALRLTALLACGGEFAFVVLKLAGEQGLLSVRQHSLLVLAITVSMALTPLLVAALARLLGTRKAGKPAREYDTIVTAPPRVIVAGYGRMGQIVARLLRAEGVPFVALDHSAEQMDMVQRFGRWNDTFYGDTARPELLRAAQADKAEVFVLAIDDAESALQVARHRQHAWRLMDLGIHEPVRETLYSSLKLGEQVLHGLGFDDARVHARVERFRQQDAELLRAQYLVYDDEAKLVQTTREAQAELDRLFEADARPARDADGGHATD